MTAVIDDKGVSTLAEFGNGKTITCISYGRGIFLSALNTLKIKVEKCRRQRQADRQLKNPIPILIKRSFDQRIFAFQFSYVYAHIMRATGSPFRSDHKVAGLEHFSTS